MKNLGRSTLFLLGYLLIGSINAQNQDNPFELLPRIEVAEEEVTEEEISSTGNPFDMVASPNPSTAPRKKVKKRQRTGNRSNNHQNTLLIVLLLNLGLLVFIASIFRPYIEKVYLAFLTNIRLNQLFRERENGIITPFLILYSLFFYNAGIFIFLTIRHWEVMPINNAFLQILWYTFLVALVLFIKHALVFLVGLVFPIRGSTSLYSFTIMVFGIMIGMFLLPINFLFAFSSERFGEILIYFSLVVIILIYLLRSLRGLFIAGPYLGLYKFHFLLYICTIEIAPSIILLKILLNQLS